MQKYYFRDKLLTIFTVIILSLTFVPIEAASELNLDPKGSPVLKTEPENESAAEIKLADDEGDNSIEFDSKLSSTHVPRSA